MPYEVCNDSNETIICALQLGDCNKTQVLSLFLDIDKNYFLINQSDAGAY